jgi:outer membrane lipoprotein LolB
MMCRIGLAVSLGLLLSACQLQPTRVETPQNETQWAARQLQLAEIRHFTLQGRIASSGLMGGTGEFSWEQDADRFTVSISGTLGVGGARIEGGADDLLIITRDGQYRAQEAETALAEKFGAPLPVADLRYWIIGLPRTGQTADLKVDDQGRLIRLDQDGWQLDYIEYLPAADHLPALPHKLWLSRGSNRWKLVVDRWDKIL